ncbi:MAG: MarR family winged helix-turn-helix transcriptional regulator [Hyphomicrobiaceae bacterium]
MTGAARQRRRAAPERQSRTGSKAEAYVLEDQVGFRLRKVHQRASEVFQIVMRDFAVTPTQFAALAKIDDMGAISQNHLGRLTAMDPATIFGVVGRLTRQGLVRQSPDPTDARLTRITLTPLGRTRVRAMKAVAAQVSAKTLEPLSPDEARTFVALLARLG